jgi:hypothetical protein
MESSITWSLVVAIIGYILTLIGVIWYEVNKRNGTPASIWTYIFMIGGTIVVIAGLILITAFFVNKHLGS